MLKRYLPFLLLLSVIVSCSKDKPNTKPSLKFKSINGNEFFPGSQVNIALEFTDKEGDLGNGKLTYIRERTNLKPITDPASNDKADSINTVLPEFPNTTSGEINLLIDYNFLDEDPLPANDSANASLYNDTMVFKIFVTDVQGNMSDTIISPQIIQRSF
jgi:hypothetical protein